MKSRDITERGNKKMNKIKIPLPEFNTIDEIADFFDKTDTTHIDGFEEVDIKFYKNKEIITEIVTM